ncbi:hypothetical protein [Blastomonas sp.]|uniref:hypothetical protein n=1 Tax=Blastomonas sp. TaxID=1909299 RepID=UPI00406A2D43
MPVDYRLVLDTLIDLSHAMFLHAGTLSPERALIAACQEYIDGRAFFSLQAGPRNRLCGPALPPQPGAPDRRRGCLIGSMRAGQGGGSYRTMPSIRAISSEACSRAITRRKLGRARTLAAWSASAGKRSSGKPPFAAVLYPQ